MGKDEDSIAIRVDRGLQKPKMTLAAFERAMQKEMDPT
jgi:flagellar motor switch protein FliM